MKHYIGFVVSVGTTPWYKGGKMQDTTARETSLLDEEITRATEGEAWHGPSIREALAGVDCETASARPIATAHSIWEIVLHLTAWATEVERRLREQSRRLLGEQDWPRVASTTADAWTAAQEDLVDAHLRLRHSIREFSPARLAHPVPFEGDRARGDDGSFYVMLHGLAQHDAYHTGQIAMLKKAQGR